MAAIGAALPIISGVASVIGAGATLIGGMQEAEAARAEGQAIHDAEMENAAIAQQNKIIANQQRLIDIATSEADAQDSEVANRRNLATIRAAMGASGTSMQGSPLDTLTDVATVAARDTERVRQEGRARNREGVLAILGYERDKKMAKKRAKYALEAGERGASAAGINTVTRLTRLVPSA